MLTALAMVLVLSAPDAGAGSIDREVVRKVIFASRGTLRGCYEPHVKDLGSARWTLAFVIAETGRVSSASMTSSLSNPKLSECIETVAKAWVFPRPVGGPVTVRYPFLINIKER